MSSGDSKGPGKTGPGGTRAFREIESKVEVLQNKIGLPVHLHLTEEDREIRKLLIRFVITNDKEVLRRLEALYPFLLPVVRNVPLFPVDTEGRVSVLTTWANRALLVRRIESARRNAEESFWKTVIAEFPEARTGDLAFAVALEFSRVCRKTITEWVDANVGVEPAPPAQSAKAEKPS